MPHQSHHASTLAPADMSAAQTWILALLRPVAAFALRHNVSLQDLIALLKRTLVESAVETLEKAGEDANASRIAASTGVHRKDVGKFLSGSALIARPSTILARVITQWRHDPTFAEKSGRPRPLSFEGPQSDFSALVTSISADIKPATVLFELERIGAVKKIDNHLRLISRVRSAHGDPAEAFRLVGADIRDLVGSAEENVFNRATPPNLHAKTEFDNIAPEALARVRRWLFEEGKRLHQRARVFLAKYDRDINRTGFDATDTPNTGARVALGTFSLIEVPSATTTQRPLRSRSERTR